MNGVLYELSNFKCSIVHSVGLLMMCSVSPIWTSLQVVMCRVTAVKLSPYFIVVNSIFLFPFGH